MAQPIYAKNDAPNNRPAQCNAGLWFERFFDQYDKNDNWKVHDQKNDWLKNNFNRSTGQSEQLEAHALRQLKLSETLHGCAKVFATEWHFVTGMGNPHPVENGLNWHPTLGVPYLTGASVKGLVRNWLEVWEPESHEDEQKAKLLKWFGSTSKDSSEEGYEAATGDLIFFDAFPTEAVTMQVDIMTPHMGKWYEKGGEIRNIQKDHDKLPADWHDPTPIPFLVVKKARFLFSVAPRHTNSTIDIAVVMQALDNALNFIGAGAKTAVGYGQMRVDERESQSLTNTVTEQAHQTALLSMTEEQQQIVELQQLLENDKTIGNKAAGNPTNQRLLLLIKQSTNWEPADKKQLADVGEAIFNYIGWGKGKKKRERKAIFEKLRESHESN